MSSDVWTASEQGNLALIQAVKRHPCLYNNTLPEYSQKDVTNAAWQEIAQQFGCSVLACKRKWKSFRSALSRELRKQRKKPNRVHEWFYSKPLSFLLPYTLQDSNDDSQVNKLKEENKESILGLPYVTDNDGLPCNKPPEEPQVPINIVNSSSNLPTIGNYLLQIPQLFVIQSVENEKIVELKGCSITQQSFDETSQIAENLAPQANDFNNLTVEPTIIKCMKAKENDDAIYKAKDKADKTDDKSILGNLRRRRQFIHSLMPEVNLMTETQFFIFKRKLFRLMDSLSES